ncbi:MAG: hypothetical protein DMD25_03330 [Gemmatimonadetes bacterium]|nr:MAG: hypothetical protein DMD27_04490 [Gemmatimonadota bacterium]PYP06587.1 MAG: hypothetical protein DMD57_01785 [Gemmatimonadota bacterium]PYP12837.1 MAG: hypothetical protein DMD56_02620 [Gemmatimonadota bacterium]PYP80617.1 MAG: hypothetical protein DMD25_03330 [Gemmatimonadota bacterium]
MPPEAVPASPRRARRVALLLLGASLVLAAGGALWFLQFASRVRGDPALIYREPATLEKLLERANDAERAGDRATAITTYRFVMAVGQGVGADLAPYVVAARAGLTRLGAGDTLPGRPR